MVLFFERTVNASPDNSLWDASDIKSLLNSKSKKIWLHNICKSIVLFQVLHIAYVSLYRFQEDAGNMIFLSDSKCCCFWNHNFRSNTFAYDLDFDLSSLQQKYGITRSLIKSSYEWSFLSYESAQLVCKRKGLLSKIG
jgi:hypothetical protein